MQLEDEEHEPFYLKKDEGGFRSLLYLKRAQETAKAIQAAENPDKNKLYRVARLAMSLAQTTHRRVDTINGSQTTGALPGVDAAEDAADSRRWFLFYRPSSTAMDQDFGHDPSVVWSWSLFGFIEDLGPEELDVLLSALEKDFQRTEQYDGCSGDYATFSAYEFDAKSDHELRQDAVEYIRVQRDWRGLEAGYRRQPVPEGISTEYKLFYTVNELAERLHAAWQDSAQPAVVASPTSTTATPPGLEGSCVLPEQPSHIQVWKQAQAAFEAVFDVWGKVAEMCSQEVQLSGIEADEREQTRQSLLDLDELLSQPCYRAAITGWGKHNQQPDWGQPEIGEPTSDYVLLLSELKAEVENLLVEMTHGREERDVSFWPGCSRKWGALSKRSKEVVAAIERTPEVRAELLARARTASSSTTDDRPAREDRSTVSKEAYFILARFDLFVDATLEPMDEVHVLARVENLTHEQATVLGDALAEEAATIPSRPSVWLESETESERNPGRHVRRTVKVREMQDTLSSGQLSANDHLVVLAEKVRRLVEAVQGGPEAPRPSKFEVVDTDTGKLVLFDTTDTEKYGPVHEEEGWEPFENCPTFFVTATAYRHASAHWTLVSEREHCAAGVAGPPEAHRLSDAQAADWLLRHGFEAPQDIAPFAAESFFAPGSATKNEQDGIGVTPTAADGGEGSSERTAGSKVDDESSGVPAAGRSRLSVDVQALEATLDGTVYKLEQDEAIYVDAMIKAHGDWVAGHTLDMRADRVKKGLPSQIHEIIESEPGKGHRIPRRFLT